MMLFPLPDALSYHPRLLRCDFRVIVCDAEKAPITPIVRPIVCSKHGHQTVLTVISAKVSSTDGYCIKLPIIMGANKALYPSSSPSLMTDKALLSTYPAKKNNKTVKHS